jgi:hypothetical protein
VVLGRVLMSLVDDAKCKPRPDLHEADVCVVVTALGLAPLALRLVWGPGEY